MAREGLAGAGKDSQQKFFAYCEMVAPGVLGLGAGITCALVTLFTLLGPLDTDLTLGWIERAALWSVTGVLNFATWYSGCVLTLYLVRLRPLLQVRLALAVMVAIVAWMSVTFTYTIYGLFHDGNSLNVGVVRTYLFSLVFLLFVMALTDHVLQLRLKVKRLAAANGYAAGIEQTIEQTMEESEVPGRGHSAKSQQFFCDLPETLGRDVIFLKATGHYVEVHTTAGSSLILMRLADAIDALGDSGMRVHRSYWIAYRHVTHLMRRDRHRRTLLRVTGRHEVPVSRSFLSEVREALANTRGPSHEQRVEMQQQRGTDHPPSTPITRHP